METMKLQQMRLYITFLVNGLIMGNSTLALSIMLTSKNLSNGDLAEVVAISFLGAIVQPLIGAISDNMKHRKHLVAIFGAMIAISSLTIFYTSSIPLIKLSVFILSVGIQAAYIILDSIIVVVCHDYKLNYGFVRSGMSLGFGFSILLSLPFIYFIDTSFMLIINAFLGVLTFVLAMKLHDDVCEKSEVHYVEELKVMVKNKIFLVVLGLTVLMYLVNTIKLNYQTIKLEELNVNYFWIALASFIIIIPELILMPRYEKLFGKFTFIKVFLVATLIFIVNLLSLASTNNIYLIMLIVPLHGLGSALYIPRATQAFRILLKPKVLSSGLLLRSTLTSIFSGILGATLIKYLFVNFGTSYVFTALTLILLLNFVGFYALHKMNYLEKT